MARRLEQMAAAEDLSQAELWLEAIQAECDRFEALVSRPDWVETVKQQQDQNAQSESWGE